MRNKLHIRDHRLRLINLTARIIGTHNVYIVEWEDGHTSI